MEISYRTVTPGESVEQLVSSDDRTNFSLLLDYARKTVASVAAKRNRYDMGHPKAQRILAMYQDKLYSAAIAIAPGLINEVIALSAEFGYTLNKNQVIEAAAGMADKAREIENGYDDVDVTDQMHQVFLTKYPETNVSLIEYSSPSGRIVGRIWVFLGAGNALCQGIQSSLSMLLLRSLHKRTIATVSTVLIAAAEEWAIKQGASALYANPIFAMCKVLPGLGFEPATEWPIDPGLSRAPQTPLIKRLTV